MVYLCSSDYLDYSSSCKTHTKFAVGSIVAGIVLIAFAQQSQDNNSRIGKTLGIAAVVFGACALGTILTLFCRSHSDQSGYEQIPSLSNRSDRQRDEKNDNVNIVHNEPRKHPI